MRYLLLVYKDDQGLSTLPAGEGAALARACRENDAALRASGYLLAAVALDDDAAATVRAAAEGCSIEPGPAAAAPPRLRAILTLHARDLNEAIQVAAAMPQARLGPIEVRPLREAP